MFLHDTDDCRKLYAISAGLPHDSVLGSILWNIMYDGVLKLRLLKEAQIVSFAEEIALVIRKRREKHLD